MGKTILVTTLGCKVNQYDSGAIAKAFRAAGFGEYADEAAGPDVVIVNTCVVTSESERKSRQAIRRMRAKYPGALLAVAGCYASKFPEKAAGIAGVDYIAGVTEYGGLADRIIKKLGHGETGRLNEGPADISAGGGRTRALIKIQDGCDSYCSYCIVPYARGRARSRGLAGVLAEADRAIANGAPEIVLTGTHISSYNGTDETGTGGAGLGELIAILSERLQKNDARIRLRLSSLEPGAVTPEFIESLYNSRGALCPHFHLSLQSGCEPVLRRMNRRYTPAQFSGAVEALRGAFPGAGVTTDVIVGFPGETCENFDETLKFCRAAAFSKIHVFPYSKRPGTEAAEYAGQVGPDAKRERAGRLLALSDELSLAFHNLHIGKEVEILAESARNGLLEGLTGNYVRVRARYKNDSAATDKMTGIISGAPIKNPFITVKTVGATPQYMDGVIINC